MILTHRAVLSSWPHEKGRLKTQLGRRRKRKGEVSHSLPLLALPIGGLLGGSRQPLWGNRGINERLGDTARLFKPFCLFVVVVVISVSLYCTANHVEDRNRLCMAAFFFPGQGSATFLNVTATS